MNKIQVRSEKLVLYACITRADLIHGIMNKISLDMFKVQSNKTIFEAIISLYIEQKTIDTITVFQKIMSLDSMYKEQAQSELTSLVGMFTVINPNEFENAILFIIAESVRLEHENLGSEIMEMSRSNDYDPQDVLDFVQNHITTNKYNSIFKKKNLTNEDMVTEVEAQMKRARDKGGISGLPSGYKEFDELTTGGQPTNLIIVAARPAMGKTAFALGIFEHLSVRGDKKGIFFSCEMDEPQVAKRVICINGGIRGYSVKFGRLSREEHLSWIRSSKRFSECNGKIMSKSWSINEIVSKCHEESNKNGLDYIIVDYIQLVRSKGNGTKNSEVEEVTNKLKALANELKIPVYALAQLSRAVEARTDKKPMLSDLRDSGAIEQDADIVTFLYRPSYYMDFDEREGHPMEKDGYLIVAKHRDGELKDILLKFEGNIPAFMDKNARDIIPVIEQKEMGFVSEAIKPNNNFESNKAPF